MCKYDTSIQNECTYIEQCGEAVFCFCLLPLLSLVATLALVSVLVIAYIHTDQEWTATILAVVFLKADIAPDSA